MKSEKQVSSMKEDSAKISKETSSIKGSAVSNAKKSKSVEDGSMDEKQTTMSEAPEGLREFFVDGLKDIYYAEKALTKAIPKMIKNATSQELIEALTNHLEETKGQVKRLEEVFQTIGEKAKAETCDAIDGLIEEAEGIMEDTEKGQMRDAGIIAAGQKVEHYEIATYGTLAAYAGFLGLEEAKSLLAESLQEEKAADEKLTEITPAALMVAQHEEEYS
jgi:ferritin-like metal-binding protein YciE